MVARRMRTPFPLHADLPDCLAFEGEFGAEVNSFIPFIHWLHQAGLMAGRRIATYAGMRAFYPFLAPQQIEERAIPRRYVHPGQRPAWLPNRDDHASRRSSFEWFPDYRATYGGGGFESGLPLCVVHNKVTPEWGRPPVNVFSLPLLEAVFHALGDRFRLVYIRPGLRGTPTGYSTDHQPDLPFDDRALLARHPQVEVFDDIAAQLGGAMSFNEAKLRLYAQTRFHLTVQGGNAHLISLFSGGLHAVLHRMGQEIRQSYATGHFGYAATPPPTWLICRTEAELRATLPVFRDAVVAADRVLVAPAQADVVAALSPHAQCGADRMLPPDLQTDISAA